MSSNKHRYKALRTRVQRTYLKEEGVTPIHPYGHDVDSDSDEKKVDKKLVSPLYANIEWWMRQFYYKIAQEKLWRYSCGGKDVVTFRVNSDHRKVIWQYNGVRWFVGGRESEPTHITDDPPYIVMAEASLSLIASVITGYHRTIGSRGYSKLIGILFFDQKEKSREYLAIKLGYTEGCGEHLWLLTVEPWHDAEEIMPICLRVEPSLWSESLTTRIMRGLSKGYPDHLPQQMREAMKKLGASLHIRLQDLRSEQYVAIPRDGYAITGFYFKVEEKEVKWITYDDINVVSGSDDDILSDDSKDDCKSCKEGIRDPCALWKLIPERYEVVYERKESSITKYPIDLLYMWDGKMEEYIALRVLCLTDDLWYLTLEGDAGGADGHPHLVLVIEPVRINCFTPQIVWYHRISRLQSLAQQLQREHSMMTKEVWEVVCSYLP